MNMTEHNSSHHNTDMTKLNRSRHNIDLTELTAHDTILICLSLQLTTQY